MTICEREVAGTRDSWHARPPENTGYNLVRNMILLSHFHFRIAQSGTPVRCEKIQQSQEVIVFLVNVPGSPTTMYSLTRLGFSPSYTSEILDGAAGNNLKSIL